PVKGEPAGASPVTSGRVTALAFDPRGHWLAVACGEPGKPSEVRLYRLADDGRTERTHLVSVTGHKDAVYALAFAPDGKTLATAGYDRVINLWDVPQGPPADSMFLKTPRLALKDHSDTVYGLAFHPGGELLASAGADRVVKAWDAAKMTERKIYPAQPDSILDLALRPDGKQLALARFDGAALLVDPATGQPTAQPLPAKPTPPKPTKLSPAGVVRGST